MRIWRISIMSVLLVYLTSAQALTTQIINYVQLVKAVEGGDDVKAIVHFDRCQIKDEALQEQFAQNLDGASTRFNFTQFAHYKLRVNGQLRDNVVTSRSLFEKQPIGKVEINFGRLRVFEDNTAEIHIDFFDPNKKERLVIKWLCDISDGHDDNGLVLFNSP